MSAFRPDLFAGRRYAVVGLGKSGLPAAQGLRAMGAQIAVWDDSEEARKSASGFPLIRDDFAFDALVLSPGIPHLLPKPHPLAERARAAGMPILAETELLFQAVRRAGSRARFAGITGTNGKSTTTAMLAHVLNSAGYRAVAGANLGPAALSLPLLPDDGIYVLEMSSYMLERIATLRFDAAAMLNLSADHLDRHGDMEGYARAKRAIFDRQLPGNLAVVGIDDADSRALADSLPRKPVTVSGEAPAGIWCDGGVLRDSDGPILHMADAAALPGSHNAQNAAAVSAMAMFFGVSRDAIARGITSFPGLPHRQQRVATVDGIVFINDSKATNADSAARALSCHERVIWIAGGMAKEGGIEPLTRYFPGIARTFLIGRDAPILAATLARHGARHETVGTLEAAVTAAFQAAKQEGAPVVLLSPACASWDQFTGYDQRGDRFAELARGLTARAA
ncbi:MAG: UDP-N-acetylmuramoyl-L-alanine--D-glutamate ligase [Acetobacteraceae bacterium]|nr:UDP-N-acetylmuramoyl-L-alanine--D-glutamate ligase [Acetobacteraceae bacterium]